MSTQADTEVVPPKKRKVLTLRVEIHDDEASDWIWKAYPKPQHGITVNALAWGDLFQERDRFAKAAGFYVQDDDETVEEAVDRHLEVGGYESLQTAIQEGYKECRNIPFRVVSIRGDVLFDSKDAALVQKYEDEGF